MAFTYDLTTSIGKVRLTIGDTVAAEAHFTDEELQVFLADGETVNAAAGLALTAWAAALAREDEQVKVGSWQGDRRDVTAKMLKLASTLLTLGGYEPAAKRPTFRVAGIDWTAHVAAERETREE